MPSNQDGEFELILGNKQLLSVFFIVVVLLGVFFAMGYVVGRNSTPLRADAGGAPKTAASGDTPRTTAETPAEPARTETQPPPAAAPEREQPQATEPAPAPDRTHTAEPTRPTAPAPEEKAAADAPPAGIYWQVAATRQVEADMLVDLLKGKGFKARTVPAPGSDGYFRVIVGPAPNTAALSSLKASLEAAGYKQPIKRDY